MVSLLVAFRVKSALLRVMPVARQVVLNPFSSCAQHFEAKIEEQQRKNHGVSRLQFGSKQNGVVGAM